MTRVIARALVVALFACAHAVPVASQERVPQDRPSSPRQMSPAQVQQLFDAMLVKQARQALSLSEEQYAEFIARLKVLQDTRRRNLQERFRLIGELQRLTNPRSPGPGATDAEIRDRLDALQALESRAAAELRRAYHGVDEVLDVRQRARFRVFEQQIERRKLELIGRARQGNSNRQPQSRRPPPHQD